MSKKGGTQSQNTWMIFYMHVQVGATFFGMHVQIDGKESINLRPSSHEFLCEKWPSEMPHIEGT